MIGMLMAKGVGVKQKRLCSPAIFDIMELL